MAGSVLPIWALYLQAFSTPIIAVIAATIASYIAWRQWKTANEKVVLDLHERRMAIYDAVRSVISVPMTTGETTWKVVDEFDAAIDRLPLFFGKDVEDYIKRLRASLSQHSASTSLLKSRAQIDMDAEEEIRRRHQDILSGFYKEFPPLVAPYIQMHQKISTGSARGWWRVGLVISIAWIMVAVVWTLIESPLDWAIWRPIVWTLAWLLPAWASGVLVFWAVRWVAKGFRAE